MVHSFQSFSTPASGGQRDNHDSPMQSVGIDPGWQVDKVISLISKCRVYRHSSASIK